MSEPASDRLEAISAELADILESRIQELMDVMRVTEATTRQVVSTELEIARSRAIQETLSAEMSALRAEVIELRARADAAQAQQAALLEERRTLRDSVALREREVRSLTTEVEDARRSQLNLGSEADSLRKENAELGGRVRTLDDNVTRLRILKNELVSSLTGLSQQMAELRLGGKE